MRVIHPFLVALQFLTRLPVRLRHLPDDNAVGRSVLYYPLIGLLIGLSLAALNWGLIYYNAPNTVRAALLVVWWVAITGALHLDGLADTVDAWIGGNGNRQRTLAIMKDPASGPMGVSALLIVLLLKYATLSNIYNQQWEWLMLVPFFARCALSWLIVSLPYVRVGGLGETLASRAPKRATHWVVILFCGTAMAFYSTMGIYLCAAMVSVYLIWSYLLRQRLGGYTGDTAGALVETAETVLLLTLTLMQTRA